MVQSEARRHYVLVGHSPAFDCGPDYNGRTFVEKEAATFQLLTNGSLRGSFPGQNMSTVQVWDRAQYCLLIGAVPDFSYTYSDYRVYPSVKVTNIFFVLPANCFMKLYIIQALLRSLSPFLENERGRVDTCL